MSAKAHADEPMTRERRTVKVRPADPRREDGIEAVTMERRVEVELTINDRALGISFANMPTKFVRDVLSAVIEIALTGPHHDLRAQVVTDEERGLA